MRNEKRKMKNEMDAQPLKKQRKLIDTTTTTTNKEKSR